MAEGEPVGITMPLIDRIPFPYWEWSVGEQTLRFNRLFSRLTGLRPDAAITIDEFLLAVTPRSRSTAANAFDRVPAGGRLQIDLELSGESDDPRWFRITGEASAHGTDGRVTEITGTMVDIHDCKFGRIRNEFLEQQLELFLAYTPAAIAMFDAEMRYMAVSQGWLEQYGLHNVELIGKTHYEVFPDIPNHWKILHQRTLAGESLSNPCDRFEREDGSTSYIAWQLEPWFETSGLVGGLVMFTQVITQQVESELHLKDARIKADAANRAKSEFLTNVSHEIRTPLNAILGFIELLGTDELEDLAFKREATEAVRRNGDKLLHLMHQILDLSQIEADRMKLDPAPMRLSDLRHRIENEFAPRAKAAGIEFDVAAAPDLPIGVRTDAERLFQVIDNLVDNAIKFTPEGSVRVAISGKPGAGGKRNAPYDLQIEVTDTGIGMEPDAVRHAFEAFYQADSSSTRRFGGSGLGLRIAKRICDLFGGRLSVDSELGRGSTFTAHIPVQVVADAHTPASKIESKAATAAPPCEQRRPLEGLRILVAEDGVDNRRLVTHILERNGVELTMVENGEEAIRAVLEGEKRGDRPFDLVLMDMQMPICDGYEASKTIRSHGVDIPIVAFTAHAMKGDDQLCRDAGCDDYVTKPVDRRKLVDTIARWTTETT